MKRFLFLFMVSLLMLSSCNDGEVAVEITVKSYGCDDNASLARTKPSFEFTLNETKGQCDANCVLYIDTVDYLHNRKQHMDSVDVSKNGFQLFVLETSTEAKCQHWEEGRHDCSKSKCKVGYE